MAGLVEWPTVLMGSFDEAYLAIPGEVIRATIRANQKCFVLRQSASAPSPLAGEGWGEGSDQTSKPVLTPLPSAAPPPSPARGEGQLANRFLLTTNQLAPDGGKAIIAGNERVVRARLSDALHFWNTDQKPLPDVDALKASADKLGLDLAKPLDQRMARLDHLGVVFHEKLGTQGERVSRIAALARELAKATGADPDLCARAAVLAKADLQSEVVGEFPELQGFMGRRYAELQGEHPSVCIAIEDHYKPLGPSDRVPTDKVAITVALADKLDTLVGFWAIDEKPTGSKDPYALRRAALGVIRLVVENGVRLASMPIFAGMRFSFPTVAYRNPHETDSEFITRIWQREFESLLSFFHERLKGSLRDAGARHDLVDAVLGSVSQRLADPSPLAGEGQGEGSVSPGKLAQEPSGQDVSDPSPHLSRKGRGDFGSVNESASAEPSSGHTDPSPDPAGHPLPQGERETSNDDLLLIVRRVEALTAFLATEDGANLLAGTKRAANILKAEEKKDGDGAFAGEADAGLLSEPSEMALHAALLTALPEASTAAAHEDFAGAMTALATLRAPVDAFFEAVMVNAPDPAIRINRLKLLASLRAATLSVADFSKIGG